MTAIEVGFKEEKEDDDPEPLRMEHFYFPLGLWLAGIVLSAILFLAEIICLRISDVSMLTEKDPGVSQSTPQVEDNKV